MVNIQLDQNHFIDADRHQWILVKDGRNIGFFESLDGLIQSYFKQKIRCSQAKSITGLVEYHNQCLSKLQQLLAPLEIEVKGNNSTKRPKDLEGKK